MNVIVIASVVVAAVVLLGALLAIIVRGFSRAVVKEQTTIQAERSGYNTAVTMGHAIPVSADYDVQLKVAKQLAARRAALSPRGSNLGIGSVGDDKQPTAFDGVQSDPITAVKIAQFHGWEGLRTGSTMQVEATTVVKAPAQTVAPVKGADNLIPGVDYPYTEITDDMSPAEKRKTRIANAKAKSAAMKTAKATSTITTGVVADAGQTESQVQSAAVPATAPTTMVGEPVPGVDFIIIDITEDMSPDEKRKARIANAKAKSAAMKSFKQSGGAATTTVAQGVPSTEPSLAPLVEVETTNDVAIDAPAISSEIPADIPKPEYVKIEDGMDPADLRKARIHNAKEKSAYKKALKAAGFDPALADG